MPRFIFWNIQSLLLEVETVLMYSIFIIKDNTACPKLHSLKDLLMIIHYVGA
jgi:hypothetical protein